MESKQYKRIRTVKNTVLSVLLSASVLASGIGLVSVPSSQAAEQTGKVHWMMSQNGKGKGTISMRICWGSGLW